MKRFTVEAAKKSNKDFFGKLKTGPRHLTAWACWSFYPYFWRYSVSQ